MRVSAKEQEVLNLVSRVRVIRLKEVKHYGFSACSDEALRKLFERICKKGFLAASILPSGEHIFRMSKRWARLMEVPASWANSPSDGVAAEALSVSALAWKKEEYLFLKPIEFKGLVSELVGEAGAWRRWLSRRDTLG